MRPTPQDAQWAAARWPGTTVDELDKGRAIYVRKCDGCHNLRRPEEYPAERWPSLVDHMGERVELTADERERMIRYLTTSSARVRGHEDASEKDLSDSSRPGTE